MGGGKPKRAKIPPPAAPKPDPVPLDIETIQKERHRRRQKLRKFGRQGTILTSGLGTSEQASEKGTLLGGTA